MSTSVTMSCTFYVLEEFEDDAPHVHLIFALEVCSFACSKNSPSYVVRFQNPKHLVPLISLSLVLELHHEIQVLDAWICAVPLGLDRLGFSCSESNQWRWRQLSNTKVLHHIKSTQAGSTACHWHIILATALMMWVRVWWPKWWGGCSRCWFQFLVWACMHLDLSKELGNFKFGLVCFWISFI